MGYSFEESVDLCKESIPPRGKVYLDNPHLGLVASMVKWYRICNDLDPAGVALNICGLCHSYLPKCENCGLGSAQSKCTDRGKPFWYISAIFRSSLSKCPNTVFSDLDPSVQVHYIDMYSSVRCLCTPDQLIKFDEVFK